MRNIMRRTASASLAIMLLGGAGMTLSAASVNAQIRPDVRTATLDFKDGASHSYDCVWGKYWNVNAIVEEAHNGCTVRVWLHFQDPSKNKPFCVSPGRPSETPNNVPAVNLYISNNKSAC